MKVCNLATLCNTLFLNRYTTTPSYREQLYSARRVLVNSRGGSGESRAFQQFNESMRNNKILAEVRRRRYYVPRTLEANLQAMQSRKKRFMALFKSRVAEILDIHRQNNQKPNNGF